MTLNIAHVTRLGSTEAFDNPETAHIGYNNDERVIGLIVGGPASTEVTRGRSLCAAGG